MNLLKDRVQLRERLRNVLLDISVNVTMLVFEILKENFVHVKLVWQEQLPHLTPVREGYAVQSDLSSDLLVLAVASQQGDQLLHPHFVDRV